MTQDSAASCTERPCEVLEQSASEAEMMEGYRDAGDPDCPTPGSNRSAAYAHGFANGRDDLRNEPRAPAVVLRGQADAILSGNNSDDPL